MTRQQWLLPYENPLQKRLGHEFFRTIPERPGVYIMRSRQDQILYIGKSKDLRRRIVSYRQAKPDRVSRKIMRLVNLIHRIDWEVSPTEKDALLRENHLLRTYQPLFNVVNTRPQTYTFLGFQSHGNQFHFRLTSDPGFVNDRLYGAFKSRGTVRRAYVSLLRILCSVYFRGDRFEYPLSLLGRAERRTPEFYSVIFPGTLPEEELKRWRGHMMGYLGGYSKSLLERAAELLLENETVPPFYYKMIQDDLDRLDDFYERAARFNYLLRRFHQWEDSLIPQERLDDWIVEYRAGRGNGSKSPV